MLDEDIRHEIYQKSIMYYKFSPACHIIIRVANASKQQNFNFPSQISCKMQVTKTFFEN